MKARAKGLDAAVLGCTHYPFARALIQDILGENVVIFDGGEGTARELKRRLIEAGLQSPSQEEGEVIFENSLPDAGKIELCNKLLYL